MADFRGGRGVNGTFGSSEVEALAVMQPVVPLQLFSGALVLGRLEDASVFANAIDTDSHEDMDFHEDILQVCAFNWLAHRYLSSTQV